MDVKQKVTAVEKLASLDVWDLAAAISGLRNRLGRTQEGMARDLGVPLSSYVRWEKARSEPGGIILVKMLQLCPDLDSLRTFGVDLGRLGLKSAVNSDEKPGRLPEPDDTRPAATYADGRLKPRHR
jgi:DNA-binding XRE family transcriptional regulator